MSTESVIEGNTDTVSPTTHQTTATGPRSPKKQLRRHDVQQTDPLPLSKFDNDLKVKKSPEKNIDKNIIMAKEERSIKLKVIFQL